MKWQFMRSANAFPSAVVTCLENSLSTLLPTTALTTSDAVYVSSS